MVTVLQGIFYLGLSSSYKSSQHSARLHSVCKDNITVCLMYHDLMYQSEIPGVLPVGTYLRKLPFSSGTKLRFLGSAAAAFR